MVDFSLEHLLGSYCDEFRYNTLADTDLYRWHDSDDLELMQYTGLKDCKGQEIYEGDIVRSYHAIVSEATIFQVYWNIDEWDMKNDRGVEYDRGYYENGSISWGELEVIGNIYEHPELLEGE